MLAKRTQIWYYKNYDRVTFDDAIFSACISGFGIWQLFDTDALGACVCDSVEHESILAQDFFVFQAFETSREVRGDFSFP